MTTTNTPHGPESDLPAPFSTLSPATRLILGLLIFISLAIALLGVVTFVAPIVIVGLAFALIFFLFLVFHHHHPHHPSH